MSAVTKLGIYNNALHLLGERRISNLYEDREPRHVLDQNYNLSLVTHCLQLTQPRFAVKSAKLASPTTSSVHGIDEVYSFPADFVDVLRDPGTHGSIGSFFADEEFTQPINRYVIEGNTVACEIATNIWIRYISSSPQPNEFSPIFGRLVSAYLARECASRINPSRIDMLNEHYEKLRQEVIAIESVKENQFVTQKATGSLSTDQLALYNLVLPAIGQMELRGIDDDSAVRLAIDSVYATAEKVCLDAIRPKFATRVIAVTGGAPSAVHGVDNVTALPADFVTITDLWADDELTEPIHRFFIEDTNIVIDGYATAYMRYVSTLSAEANWSSKFSRAVAAWIAKELAPRFAPEEKDRLAQEADKAIQEATASEAVKESHFPQIATSLSATALQVYNIAASALAVPELRYAEDESELRHALDAIYTTSTNFLLEAISPRFASVVEALSSPSASSEHGYDNVFTLPATYKQFLGLWSDELLDEPVTRYFLEGGTVAVQSHTTVYLRYISTSAAETLWTPSFIQALGLYMASQVGPRFKPEESSRANARYQAALQASLIADGIKETPRPLAGTRTLTTAYRNLYNTALDLANLPPIISNDDESQRKVALDYALDHGAVETVLELISWGFARQSVKLEYDDVVDPAWGYQYAFAVPSDMLRINSISADEYFIRSVPYLREEDYFYSDASPLYVQYVSTNHLTTLSAWPRYFYNLVAAELAKRLGTVDGADMTKAIAKYQEYKREAYNTDAQRNPPQVIASGSWTEARFRYPTRRNSRRP